MHLLHAMVKRPRGDDQDGGPNQRRKQMAIDPQRSYDETSYEAALLCGLQVIYR